MSTVMGPARAPDPSSSIRVSSPLMTSPDRQRFKPVDLSRRTSSPSNASPTRNSLPHPLSRPPITASPGVGSPRTRVSPSPSAEMSVPDTTHNASPATSDAAASAAASPLDSIHLMPPQDVGARKSLHRRRSSFPPGVGSSVPSANAFPWTAGETSDASPASFDLEQYGSYGNMVGAGAKTGTTPGAWESLLNFDADDTAVKHEPAFFSQSKVDRNTPKLEHKRVEPARKAHGLERTVSSSEMRRAALNRTVDVDGVGSVSIARLLSEVWKRGGPAVVSNQGLWSSILTALSLSPTAGANARVGAPSSQNANALQALYNVTVQPHEAEIFAGFLSTYLASTAPPAVNALQDNAVYGASTPTKELDLSQWTTFTPGAEWPSLSTTLPSGSGLTPRREFSPALGLPPIDLSDPMIGDGRQDAPPDYFNGIEEILADMEEDKTSRETAVEPVASIVQPDWGNHSATPENMVTEMSNDDPFTDNTRRNSAANTTSPVDNMMGSANSSPFVSSASLLSVTSASAVIPTVPLPAQVSVSNSDDHKTEAAMTKPARSRPPPSLQLPLPEVPFIPPPPMCMFFSPTFRDLQHGKVAVWKGDLVVRGRGGGRFNVLIVGEENSDHIWQSYKWKETLTYPPEPAVTESYTATMIPVSTLAREGLLPVTMGMVLCNDENIGPFVNMVQGMHAEGVAFHLSMPELELPVVFLPAKFDSADPLQRLGIAFMTKGGIPPVSMSIHASRKLSDSSISSASDAPEPKRRRKNGPSAAKGEAKPRRRNPPVRPKTVKSKV